MFFDKYSELCKNVGKSVSAVAVELGIPKASVTTWKKDGYTPRAETLNKIAEYFNVSTDYLLGNEKSKDESDNILPDYLSLAKTAQELKLDPADVKAMMVVLAEAKKKK